jgi:beta-lactam-binding protein with PASTA domain
MRMASEPEKVPPAEDTVVGDEAVTLDDDGWPVDDHYLVEQDKGTADGAESAETGETLVLTQAEPAAAGPRRWLPSSAHPAVWMLAIAAAIGVLILIAVLTGLRDDDAGTTASTVPPPTNSSSPPGDTSGDQTTPVPEASEVMLPDVEGMRLAKARTILEKDGLRVVVRRLDSDRPRGEVLTQDPSAGTSVAEGDRIALVVSGGPQAEATAPPSSEVPDVVGLAASDAVAAIRDAGFEARVRLVLSSRTAGTVVRQSPAAEREATNGSTVLLEVAKARQPVVQRVRVPDVVGTSVAAARGALRSAGLTVTVVSVESQEPTGTVITQSPGAGAEVRKGASVRLSVSSGPTRVAVPDVTGRDEESARLELVNAGFDVRVTDEPTTDQAQDGVVLDQTPAAGTQAAEGAVVTLTVGRFG